MTTTPTPVPPPSDGEPVRKRPDMARPTAMTGRSILDPAPRLPPSPWVRAAVTLLVAPLLVAVIALAFAAAARSVRFAIDSMEAPCVQAP